MDVRLSKIQYYSSVTPQEVDWLWYPYIPYGRITVIQGDPGEGKTTFVLQIAAKLSTGQPLPECDKTISPQNVIYQSTEDGIADTVKPRLIAAGADCDRIAFIDDTKNPLTLDDERLEHAIRECNARLLVLDPLQAFIGADSDMHRANEMRPIFSRLGNIAAEFGCAIVLIGHQNKAQGSKNIYRGLGSIDIAAAARSILVVSEMPGMEYRRAVVHIKSSLSKRLDYPFRP